MGELTSLSAVEMAAGIQRRKFSPVDLVEAHLSRIDHLNPRLNAFVTVDREGARKAAKDAEAALERGETLGVLHGVPLTIKSSIDVAGYRCEAGTPLRAGNTPTADAPVVSRLRAAGAAEIVAEVQKSYHPFFLIPDQGRRKRCEPAWRDLLGDHVICLEAPEDTAFAAAGAISLAEGTVAELRQTAGLPGSTLEEVFLKMTGTDDIGEVVKELSR